MEQNQNPEGPKRPRGRPPKIGVTEKVVLEVDDATCVKLDDLIEYGGLGTTRTEVVMFILRLWLRDNHEKLKAEISAKLNPFSNNGKLRINE